MDKTDWYINIGRRTPRIEYRLLVWKRHPSFANYEYLSIYDHNYTNSETTFNRTVLLSTIVAFFFVICDKIDVLSRTYIVRRGEYY